MPVRRFLFVHARGYGLRASLRWARVGSVPGGLFYLERHAMKVRRLDAFGDGTFGQGHANYARHGESTAQRTRTRLLCFLGDWFLDLDNGMPWLTDFERPGNLTDIERAARMTILQTDGVAQLESLVLNLSDTRQLTVQAAIISTDGDANTLTVNINGPAN